MFHNQTSQSMKYDENQGRDFFQHPQPHIKTFSN